VVDDYVIDSTGKSSANTPIEDPKTFNANTYKAVEYLILLSAKYTL